MAQQPPPRPGTLRMQETIMTGLPWLIIIILYGIIRALIDERRKAT